VPTDATELSPPELEWARTRLGEMADQFIVEGTLRSPQWRAVFARTWRHPYVPSYYPELGVPPVAVTPSTVGTWRSSRSTGPTRSPDSPTSSTRRR